jgi:hypothetical protein
MPELMGSATRIGLYAPGNIAYAAARPYERRTVRVNGATHSVVPSTYPDSQPETRGRRAIKEGRFHAFVRSHRFKLRMTSACSKALDDRNGG